MAKKVMSSPKYTKVKKTGTKRKIGVKKKTKNEENLLIENFVSLQKVMTNLSENFKDLSKKISNLLELFEASAKALTGKEIRLETPPIDEKKILQGLENISEQNKIIARGLTLIHETKRETNIVKNPRKMQAPPSPIREGQYQKSQFSQEL